MSKIIITGATGNAGSATLSAALASPHVSGVTVISRRAPAITHPKLTTILVPSAEHPGSFEKLPPSVLDAVKDHQGVIWALGVSSTQVKGAEYAKITHDYPIVAAEEFKKLGSASEPFRFVYMSGGGARQDGKAMQEWANVKGQTERDLKAMETDSFQVLSIRPGGIMPTPEHYPNLPRSWRWGLHPIGRVLQVVYPPIMIESTQLGKACVDLVLGRGDAWARASPEGVLENDVLRKM